MLDKINLIIIVFLIFYVNNKLTNIEKATNTPDSIREAIKQVYQADVQAIKNLGDIANTMITEDGTLTLPYNVNITGGLTVNEDINMKANKSIRCDGRLHIFTNERLCLLAVDNTWITGDWGGDGNLIVGGNSSVDDNLTVDGNTQALGGMSVEGKLYFRHNGANGSDDTDPYYIEKVRTESDKNTLRLTINDTTEEAFEIWGNSCGTGDCGSAGSKLFQFNGSGDLSVGGGLTVNEDINMKDNKSIRCDGRLHIFTNERLYLLAVDNTWITHDWGGDGNLKVTGNVDAPNLVKKNTDYYIYQIDIHTGNKNKGWKYIHGHSDGRMALAADEHKTRFQFK